MPHGNVDDTLFASGNILMVCGPIFWSGDPPGSEKQAKGVIVHSLQVVLANPAGTGVQIGAGTFSNVFTPPAEDWMATVQVLGDRPLAVGDTVRINVMALVRNVDGSVRLEPWMEDATITDVAEG